MSIEEGQYTIQSVAYANQVAAIYGDKGLSAVLLGDRVFTSPSTSVVGETRRDQGLPQQLVRRWSCSLGNLALNNLSFFSGFSWVMQRKVLSLRTSAMAGSLLQTATKSLCRTSLPYGSLSLRTKDASSLFTQSSSLISINIALSGSNLRKMAELPR